jgi:hypothetical protein
VYSVLALGSPAGIGPCQPFVNQNLARQTPVFSGSIPSSYTAPFAIMIDPIPAGGIGRAAIQGVVPCQVTVNADGDMFCGPSVSISGASGGTVSLVSATDNGPAQILWPSTTSAAGKTVQALVHLMGNTGAGGASLQAVFDNVGGTISVL